MLLEHEAEQLETGEDVAEACEALDFEDCVSGVSGSSIVESADQGLTSVTRASMEKMTSSTPGRSPSKVMTGKLSSQYPYLLSAIPDRLQVSVSTTVTADIHDHVVKPMQSDLPDLLPRPEPPRGRHYSEEQGTG